MKAEIKLADAKKKIAELEATVKQQAEELKKLEKENYKLLVERLDNQL